MAEVKASVTLEDIQKIARQIAECFHPQRVILFGSYARGIPTEESDLDLCVVMDTKGEDPFSLAQRIEEMIDRPVVVWGEHTMRLWVQIHVLSPEEFEASLLRTGVFVTNIAKEGIVLYEAPDATPISKLLAQQQAWEGPGAKPETQEWVEKSEDDWAVVQQLMQVPNPIYDAVCFHAQQCAEKYLKAFLEEHSIVFPKTHDLIELLDKGGGLLPELDPLRLDLKELSKYAVIPPLSWLSGKPEGRPRCCENR